MQPNSASQLRRRTQSAAVPSDSGREVGPVEEISEVETAQILAAIAGSRSSNTRRAYKSDWRRFSEWCSHRRHQALPADPLVVAAYLTDAASSVDESGEFIYAPSTLARWVSAIAYSHRVADYMSPTSTETVSATLSGIKRAYAAAGSRPPRRAAPLLTSDIVAIVNAARSAVDGWASDVLERRDSALLLVGYTGAFRRGDLVDLVCGDVRIHHADGIHVRLRRSKTDQEGRGSVRALPFTQNYAHCPPCALLRWMDVVATYDAGGRPALIRTIKTDEKFDGHVCRQRLPSAAPRSPLFRAIRKNGNVSEGPLSGAAVHAAVRRRTLGAGYDSSVVATYGGHSLRAGFVTQAFRNGADAHAIMRQTGHSDLSVLETYRRENAPLIGNAVTGLGL